MSDNVVYFYDDDLLKENLNVALDKLNDIKEEISKVRIKTDNELEGKCFRSRLNDDTYIKVCNIHGDTADALKIVEPFIRVDHYFDIKDLLDSLGEDGYYVEITSEEFDRVKRDILHDIIELI